MKPESSEEDQHEKIFCPRCYTPVLFTNLTDIEECPFCALIFSGEIPEGFFSDYTQEGLL